LLTLYYTPNTISVAVAITLEHLQHPYDAVKVDFALGEQRQPDYQKINPKGRVPALVTAAGVLTETGALLEYVAPQLVPEDPFAAARMRELMSYLNGTMHPHHAHGLRGERWADEETSFADMKRKVPQTMAACCAHLEDVLADLPFQLGQMQVLSDPYLYIVLTWLAGDGVDIAHFPRLQAFQQAMDTLPAVKAVRDKGMLS